MKRMYILLSLMIVASGLFAQDYYWYRNQKIFLEQGDEQYVLFRPGTKSGFDTSAYIKTGVANDTSLMWGIQKRNVPIASNVEYVSPSFRIKNDSSNMYATERFYVQLYHKEDYDLLVQYAAENNVMIVEEGALSRWYILSCTEQSKGNALYMANQFQESSLFAVAEPEFINSVRFTCVNENNFDQQWNLLNTGQYDSNYTGLDINYCDAHAITTGDSSIIIGVVDWGIDYHLDLSVLYHAGYDAPTSSTPAQVYGSHGTKCAGIINAQIETGWGVAGVIPHSHLLPVSFNAYTPLYNIANGMKYAADYGASVLSNSWLSYGYSNYFDSIVNYVLTEGRNGKGCVVVFAAGNDNENSIAYPANSNPDILAVGAMTPSAERANYSDWGSCYGYGLDIVAPGVNIPTTAPQGYIGTFVSDFAGTSAACPHVAGVAGLVLSVNPNLTQKEVADIIESTAQKVGDYDYDSIARNGTWDYEMGYGLVDAYAAVQKAQLSVQLSQIEIEGPTYACDSSYYYVRNAPEGATIQWSIGRSFFSALQYRIAGSNNRDSVLLAYDAPIKDLIGDTLRGHVSPPSPHDPPFPPISVNDTTVVLSVRVSKDGLSYTKRKTLYSPNMGTPLALPSDTSNHWVRNTERTFTVTNCFEVPDSSFLWTVSMITDFGPLPIHQVIGRTMSYTPTVVADYEISVTNTEKTCESASWDEEYMVMPTQMKGVRKQNEDTAIKVLRDGQLYIRREGKTYRLDGSITTCQ